MCDHSVKWVYTSQILAKFPEVGPEVNDRKKMLEYNGWVILFYKLCSYVCVCSYVLQQTASLERSRPYQMFGVSSAAKYLNIRIDYSLYWRGSLNSESINFSKPGVKNSANLRCFITCTEEIITVWHPVNLAKCLIILTSA